MPTKITGSFAGRIKTQASAVLNHESNHMLSLIEVIGVQKSPDPLWNGSKISYWGTADLVNGSGPQKGYYVNEHTDGNLEWGTFEGKITTSAQQATMEGAFKITGGNGKYQGVTGTGTYKGRFPSPGEVINEWEGDYTLASAKAAG
jgi:hypothetical protein